ncbi:hypothetical protein D3C76_999150 [compost metagenome]
MADLVAVDRCVWRLVWHRVEQPSIGFMVEHAVADSIAGAVVIRATRTAARSSHALANPEQNPWLRAVCRLVSVHPVSRQPFAASPRRGPDDPRSRSGKPLLERRAVAGQFTAGAQPALAEQNRARSFFPGGTAGLAGIGP